MTNENVERVRKSYYQLVNESDEIERRKTRLVQLEKKKSELELNLKVQVYLSIVKEIGQLTAEQSFSEKFSLTEDRILELAADEVCGKTTTNNIYVYMGTYENNNEFDIVHGNGVIVLSDDELDFGWKEYKNIELRERDASLQVTKADLDQFMSESIVLIAPQGIIPSQFYQQVRKVFFEALVKYGQEVAVETVKNQFGASIVVPSKPQLLRTNVKSNI